MVPGLLALAALGAALTWIARHSHRYVNVPLAGAALVVLVTLVGGAAEASSGSRPMSTPLATASTPPPALSPPRAHGRLRRQGQREPHPDRSWVGGSLQGLGGVVEAVTTQFATLDANLVATGLDEQLWADYVAAHEVRAPGRLR